MGLNKTQRELADYLGVDHHRLNKWLCGKAEPKVGNVIKMLDFLGYSESEAKEVFWTLYN